MCAFRSLFALLHPPFLPDAISTNAQLENECAEKETSLNSFKAGENENPLQLRRALSSFAHFMAAPAHPPLLAENKALKAKVATLENDLSVTDSKSSALRRESKQKTEQLQDEVQSLRRTKLTAEETERVLQERIGLLEPVRMLVVACSYDMRTYLFRATRLTSLLL